MKPRRTTFESRLQRKIWRFFRYEKHHGMFSWRPPPLGYSEVPRSSESRPLKSGVILRTASPLAKIQMHTYPFSLEDPMVLRACSFMQFHDFKPTWRIIPISFSGFLTMVGFRALRIGLWDPFHQFYSMAIHGWTKMEVMLITTDTNCWLVVEPTQLKY